MVDINNVLIDWFEIGLISVLARFQVQVAEEFGTKLRAYQDVMHPAAYGDSSREWAHLVLTKVLSEINAKVVTLVWLAYYFTACCWSAKIWQANDTQPVKLPVSARGPASYWPAEQCFFSCMHLLQASQD